MSPLLLRDVEVRGRRVDVLVDGPTVRAIADRLPVPVDAEVIEGAGGALLPGLWDHHIHLLALAAARASVAVGPPDVTTADDLALTMRTAAANTPADGWVRAVGHHPSVGGDLDRWRLDRLVPDRPVRIQHRSGAMWALNSRGLTELDLDRAPDGAVERTADGTPTGRLYGADAWLRTQLPRGLPPDLAAVGDLLARHGVVGVTDATPTASLDDLALIADAHDDGRLPQKLVAMGGPALADAPFPDSVARGPVKLLLADHDLPTLDAVAGWVATAHRFGRPVAVHCVTQVALVLALAALEDAGTRSGDRIEHAAVVPPGLRPALARSRATVVTQPGFIRDRGDVYQVEVDPDDFPHLYPCQSLLDAEVPVAGSTDAPFGDPDPWRAIAAATDRTTTGGAELGTSETVTPDRALALFLGAPDRPGGPPREIAAGASADLCLLRSPLVDALDDPTSVDVVLTVVEGRIVHRRSP